MTIAHPERVRLTADQYLKLGEDPPGVRLELVNGEIIVSASPSTPPAYTLTRLLVALANHVVAKNLGVVMSDTDHVLGMYDVRRPDIYFFSKDRIHLIEEGPIRHPPDLAVEVVSPTSGRVDRIEKFEQYRAFGIAHYWIVDPKARAAKAFKLLRRRKYSPAGAGSRNDIVNFPPFEDLDIALGDLWWPPKA